MSKVFNVEMKVPQRFYDTQVTRQKHLQYASNTIIEMNIKWWEWCDNLGYTPPVQVEGIDKEYTGHYVMRFKTDEDKLWFILNWGEYLSK